MRKLTKEEIRNEGFRKLVDELKDWQIPDAAVDTVHDVAQASLNEVKALTEYEDGKVSRLLTVVAFLSAVIGAVFTRFASDYTWPALAEYQGTVHWWFPFLAYAAFFTYVVIVTAAVVVLLIAIRPKFNLPASWAGAAKQGLPPSMLFYKGILDVTGQQWAKAFVDQANGKGQKLKAHYAKCYISEAYLVAQKVGDKLRWAAPGVFALLVAMFVLLAFFVFLALTVQFVPASRVLP